jgi:hypothetical protein
MTDDARTVVDSYFAAWKNNDFASMRSVLDDRLDFAGPVDRFDRADAYQQAVAGLSRMRTDIVIRKTFVAGSDVLTWYDLHTTVAAPAPVAEWSHVEQARSRWCGWCSTPARSARPLTADRSRRIGHRSGSSRRPRRRLGDDHRIVHHKVRRRRGRPQAILDRPAHRLPEPRDEDGASPRSVSGRQVDGRPATGIDYDDHR